MSEIVTGEAVALELRLAKLPSRMVAALIDFGVQFGLLFLLAALGGFLGAGPLAGLDDKIAAALLIAVLVGVFVGYPVAFETLSRGRTLGKMVMGIRVVRDDGGPISFRHALVRGLFAGLLEKPGILFALTSIVGFVTMLCSREAKRVGDYAAGTVVLQERVPAGRARTYVPVMPPPLAGWATMLDLTGLDDSLALSVRQFLARADQLAAPARADLGRRLADAVAAVTTPAPPPGAPEWAYLSAVLAERRRRDEARWAARQAGNPYAPGGERPAHGVASASASPPAPPPEPQPTPPRGPFAPPG